MSRPPIKDSNSTSGLLGLGNIPNLAPVAAFQLNQIDNLLLTKSIEAYHIKHAPNPDRNSVNAPITPDSQTGSQRGFVYYSIRKIGVVPQSISLTERFQVQALFERGSITLNVTGEYLDDCPGQDKRVYVRPHDIILLNPSITTQTSQLFEYNPTGPQRLYHRVLGVDVLFDSERKYHEGSDFCVQNGMIYWIDGGQKPSFAAGKAATLSCVYWINDIYVVQDVPHHLRILPSNSAGSGALPREAAYAPQLVIAARSSNLQESDLLNLDLYNLPSIPEYKDSNNLSGGST